MVRNFSRPVGEIRLEFPFLFQFHEIFADVKGSCGHKPAVFGGQEMRVLALQHQTTARGRNHDIIALLHPWLEGIQIEFGLLQDGCNVAHLEKRHSAALLLGPHDVHLVFFKHRQHGLADLPFVVINEAGRK